MKKLLLFFLFFLIINKLYSQSLIENMNAYSPPSPEAASLASSVGQYSVGHYNGKLNYSAPTMQVDFAGVTIDLGIRYSTSGFKVQDIAGSVGLGWNANFGGVITRYVEGLPDEEANGYCGANRIGEKNYGALNNEYLAKLGNAEWDSQPDKFYFSFLGFSGTLVLNPDGVPVLSSSTSGLKVEYNPFNRTNGRANGGLEQWILRDQKGNQYFFGAEFIERTSSVTHGEVKNVNKTFISSWFIKKIVTVNNRTILFNYTSGAPTNYTYYVNVFRNFSTSGGCSYNGPSEKAWNENVDISIAAPLYLSQIKMEGGGTTVNFSYNFNRTDLQNGKALTDIEVLYNNKVKRSFLLQYEYFTSTDGTGAKRLKNKGITEKGSAGTIKKLFSFFYDESSVLPARNSIKTDYWGYYNNNTGGSDIEGYLGATKQPYFINTKACVLTKVNYNTGGSINFEYEQNDYREGNSNVYAGGIRVKRKFEKTSQDIGDQNLINEEYIYTDPQTMLSSGELYIKQQNRQLIADNVIPYSLGGTVWFCILKNVYKYSVPLLSIFDLNETAVGYSVVSVKKINGTTRYRFTNFSDKPDEFEQKIYNTSSKIEQTNDIPGENLIPQFVGTSYSFARGKLKSEELFDTQGQKIKHSNYGYEYTVQSAPVIGLKAYSYRMFGDSKLYYFGRNRFFNQDYRLISKIDTIYKAGKSTIVTKEEYGYSTYANNLISSKTLMNFGGNVLIERLKYPFDNLANSTLSEMCSNNRISEVIEQSKYKNNVLVSKEFKNFAKWPSGLIAPSSVEQQFGTGPKRIRVLFNNYDNYGNLLESQIPNGVKESYFWGYNGNSLLAKVVGSSFNDAKQFVNLAMLGSAENYTDSQMNTELNKLRTNLPGSQVASNTYNVLIGATSQTDPKNKTAFYEYDEFGRLIIIKNQNQDLVKTYDYNITNLYQSKAITQPFTKNSCSTGLIGEQVDYVLPENTYTSFISQEDADQKAQNDININGQSYANQNGLCFMPVKVKTDLVNPNAYLDFSQNGKSYKKLYLSTWGETTLALRLGLNSIRVDIPASINKVLLCIDGECRLVGRNESVDYLVDKPGNISIHYIYYSNIEKTGFFEKNDCPLGKVGVGVNFSMLSGKYFSAISQEDADTKAETALQLDGQIYANSVGVCSPPGIRFVNNSTSTMNVRVMKNIATGVLSITLRPGESSISIDIPLRTYDITIKNTSGFGFKVKLNNSEAVRKFGTANFSDVTIGSGMTYLEMLPD